MCFLMFCTCLEGTCRKCDNANKAGTIFDCPVSQLTSDEEEIVFHQWTPKDLTEMEFDDALNGSDDVIFWCKFVLFMF